MQQALRLQCPQPAGLTHPPHPQARTLRAPVRSVEYFSPRVSLVLLPPRRICAVSTGLPGDGPTTRRRIVDTAPVITIHCRHRNDRPAAPDDGAEEPDRAQPPAPRAPAERP